MNVRRAGVVLAAGIMIASMGASGSDRATSDETREVTGDRPRAAKVDTVEGQAALPPPSDGEIARDAAAFVRSTKVVPAKGASSDCPTCPPKGGEALTVHGMKTDAASCSGETCNVMVTIRASFNSGPGGTLGGGLTAWIPVEQRTAYLSGHTPPDEQLYRVQITYKHRGGAWRAVVFDRAPAE